MVADQFWLGWTLYGDADNLMGRERDGDPCVVIVGFMFGWRNARPVCRNVGLVVAMTLLTVVFDGWLWEVDFLCCTLDGWFIL